MIVGGDDKDLEGAAAAEVGDVDELVQGHHQEEQRGTLPATMPTNSVLSSFPISGISANSVAYLFNIFVAYFPNFNQSINSDSV